MTGKALAARVHLDERRGHITVFDNEDHLLMSMVDLGPVLDVEHGCEFTPDAARELGRSLLAWADRKQRTANAPAPKWVDLFGIDPGWCGGLTVDEFMAQQRRE